MKAKTIYNKCLQCKNHINRLEKENQALKILFDSLQYRQGVTEATFINMKIPKTNKPHNKKNNKKKD